MQPNGLDTAVQAALKQANAGQDRAFTKFQEESIISLALDHPEFFMATGRFMRPDMFHEPAPSLLMAHILNYMEKYDFVPTRALVRDEVATVLTEDEDYESVFAALDRKISHRDVPALKDSLLAWAKKRAYGLLYSDVAMQAYNSGDFAQLEKIVSEANRIADVGDTGIWFFDSLEMLLAPQSVEHRTTGFPRLDKILNNGGPSPKEVVCWLAPTNVGKSILLVNNCITSYQGMGRGGTPGQDVLLVTYELDMVKTALRCLASATKVDIDELGNHKELVVRTARSIRDAYQKRIFIYELPPDECSVNNIYSLLEGLKRRDGWHPDTIILDYMDLMISRNKYYNQDDYTQQKHVANEIRGLAKNENALVFTATQTNRSGSKGEEMIDLTKAAESYAKQFSLDYVISLNQTDAQRTSIPATMNMFVAKNRNGPRNEMITCEVIYNQMFVREASH
jgi:replicative DNA helicase